MSNLRGMNTVENESSELRCLGRGRSRGRTPATSGCQVHFHAFTLSQLYGRKYLEKYLVIYGLLDLNVTKSTTQIYLSHVDEQYIEISREYLESIYS